MEKNLNELTRLAEWVDRDLRLDYIYFQTVVRPFGASASEQWFKDPKYNFLWPQDIKRVEAVINELIQLKRTNLKIVNSVSQLKAQLAYFKNPLYSAHEQDCGIGNRDININPQGDVYLCFSKESIGNVRTDSLGKIWYSDQAAKVRGVIKKCKDHCHFSLNCSFE
jgi:MoaA/NifB/PqqE/SkfB family radical SAM enzyme